MKKQLKNFFKELFQWEGLFVVLLALLFVGLFTQYLYYSTIGRVQGINELEIIKVQGVRLLGIGSFSLFIDWVLAKRSAFDHRFSKGTITAFTLILILMLSLDIYMWMFASASVVMALLTQVTKRIPAFNMLHPILVGYLVILALVEWIPASPAVEVSPFLTAPYMVVMSGELAMTWEEFRLQFYSTLTVIAGMFNGPFSFNLILPLGVSWLFLVRRRFLNWKLSGFYLVMYALIASGYKQLFGVDEWIIQLFLLNGSVLITAVFLLPLSLKTLDATTNPYLYVGVISLLTVICSYHIHFVWGPYLALGAIQVLGLVATLIETPSLITRTKKYEEKARSPI